MTESGYVVVFITTSSVAEAQKISRLLLEQKKAACVNIVPSVASAYWWEGKIESATESLLMAKTSARLLPELVSLVKSAHSYRVPEIIALPVTGGNKDYLDWIDRSLA
jgi:periplasmic divalent cation tolerance protein